MELQEKTIKVLRLIEKLINCTISPSWRFTKSGVIQLQVQEGLKQLPLLFEISDIDDERIVDYLVYQIYRMRSNIENSSFQVNWLFSQNALSKYRQQFLSVDGKSGMNYYIDQWLDDAELSRGELVQIIADPKPNPLKKMIYMPSEEPIKRRFHNTADGFTLCQTSTTGWSPLSEACKECKNWIECGKNTAKKYPELMRFRKEEYGRKEK